MPDTVSFLQCIICRCDIFFVVIIDKFKRLIFTVLRFHTLQYRICDLNIGVIVVDTTQNKIAL